MEQMYFERQPLMKEQWRHGFCQCCSDRKIFLDNLFCWICQISRQFDAAEYGSEDSLNGLICIGVCCTNWFACMASGYNRVNVRDRYNIEESKIKGCCLGFLCPLCSNIQIYKEMNDRGVYPGGTCWVPEPSAEATMMGQPGPRSTPMQQGRNGGYGTL